MNYKYISLRCFSYPQMANFILELSQMTGDSDLANKIEKEWAMDCQ
ncbi:hypothetical protein ACR31S_02875 [Streptococcus iniae]